MLQADFVSGVTEGQICLALDINDYRQPTHLPRHLKKALDFHENWSYNPELPVTDHVCRVNSSKALDRSAWKLPTLEMVSRFASKQERTLKVDIKALRCTSKETAHLPGTPVRARKRSKRLEARCQVELCFKTQGTHVVHRVSEDARLRVWQGGQDAVIDVLMEKAFMINEKALYIDHGQGRHRKAALADSYKLLFSLRFLDEEDGLEFLRMTNANQKLRKPDSYSGKRIPQLVAKWTKFPATLPEGELLQVQQLANGGKTKTCYGLEVDIGWNGSFKGTRETVVQTSNRASRSQEPTRLSSPTFETPQPKQKVRAEYIFGKAAQKAVVVYGCFCPICYRTDYQCYDRLRHHFAARHSDFVWHESRKREREVGSHLEIDAKFDIEPVLKEVEDEEEQREGGKSTKISWVAPTRAFNLPKYLAGDEDWGDIELPERRKSRVFSSAAGTPTTSSSTMASNASIATSLTSIDTTTKLGKVQPKAPKDVVNLQAPQRTKHLVQPAKVERNYYRTTSKRLIEAWNDTLSESDDDLDEAWLSLKRDASTNPTNCSTGAKELMSKLDIHIQDEQLSSDVHVGDAVIRFARKEKQWILESPMRMLEFHRKAEEMRRNQIITPAVFFESMEIIELPAGVGIPENVVNRVAEALMGRRDLSTVYRELDKQCPRVAATLFRDGPPVSKSSKSREEMRRKMPKKKPEEPSHIVNLISSDEEDNSDVEMLDVDSVIGPDSCVESLPEPRNRKPTETQNRTPTGTMADFPPRGCCAVCSDPITSTRQSVWCTGEKCRKPEYHLTCAGLKKRLPSFKCKECKPKERVHIDLT